MATAFIDIHIYIASSALNMYITFIMKFLEQKKWDISLLLDLKDKSCNDFKSYNRRV